MGDPGEEVSDEKHRIAELKKTNEEDKAVILLNSLPREEYEIFTLTLINRRNLLTTVRCLLLL